ncbi:MAG: ArnT family glycosyltransferase [Candidatus Anammoxibacter sp.]
MIRKINLFFFAGNKSTAFIYVALIIIFASLLFLFNLGKRDLWAPDEPRYAQVSREMWDSKDFVLPHLNGEKYPDKPPVLFWLIILFSIPFGGITELSARLPSAFAGIGCMIMMFYFAKRLFSERVGFITALILATSVEFLTVSRRVSFDGLLTFLVVLSLFCFHTGYIRKHRNRKFFLLSYLFMAIATITKGPVGFVMPVLVIATFLCIVKFGKCKSEFHIRDMRIWLGVVIVLSIPLLWVFGIYIEGGWEHVKEVVFTQNIGRTVNSWSHKKPFYYFFMQFPLYFLPWSIFIPGAIILYIKCVKGLHKKPTVNFGLDKCNHNEKLCICSDHSPFLFPAVWFIVVFVFFSIMSGKRSTYILPIYPAASMFIAWFLDSFISHSLDKTLKKFGYIPFQLAFVILLVMGISFPVYTYFHYYSFFVPTLFMSLIVICGTIISARYIFTKRPSIALVSSFIVFLITVMLSTQIAIPKLNEKKSGRFFCEKIEKIIGDDGKFASFNFFRSTFLFYTKQKSINVIKNIEQLNEYLSIDERVYLLIKDYHFKTVINSIDPKLYILQSGKVGHRTMLLVSNKPSGIPLQETEVWLE